MMAPSEYLAQNLAERQETMFAEPLGFDPVYEEEAPYDPGVDGEAAAEEAAAADENAETRFEAEAEALVEAEEMQVQVEEAIQQEMLQETIAQEAAAEIEETAAVHAGETEFGVPDVNGAGVEAQAISILTADDFAGLEERILRAVSLVRREREARGVAEERAAALEAQLAELQADTAVADRLQLEVDALRAEREQVRLRVERLLGQLDALEI